MAELPFLRPQWLLALLPLAALWGVLALRARRARRWEDLVDDHLQDAVLSGDIDAGRRLPMILLGFVWFLLVAALAGPTWQRELRPVYRIEQARVLMLDLSPSMDRVDAGSSRLERARFEVMDLLRAADEGQVALIGYGAEPFLISPLTSDAEIILEQVPLLAPDLLPVSGVRRTDLALDMAAALLRRSGAAGGDVVLISDELEPPRPGGDTDEDRVLAAAERLNDMGHRLSVLAMAGTGPFGELVETGGGMLVQSRIDDQDTARLIALQAGGRRVGSGERIADAGQRRDAGVWLLLLVLPLAALAFRSGWLGLLPIALCLLPPAPAQALSWNDLWLRPEQQAWRALEQGHAKQAGERFDDPRWRAAAHYRAGDYARALAELSGLQGAEAHYNRGNVLARLRRYDAAITEYDAALLIDPEHHDARDNRELLQTLLRTESDPPETEVINAGEEPESADGGNHGETDGDGTDVGPVDGGPAGDPDGSMGSAGVSAVPVGADGQDGISAGTGTDSEIGTDSSVAQDGDAADTGAEQRPATAGDQSTPVFQDRARQQSLVAADGDSDATIETGAPAMLADGGQGPLDDPAAAAAIDYLLRQVPDDPARLLRERLMLQYLRRHGQLP
jgi:Ca-activated chloride channel family protein